MERRHLTVNGIVQGVGFRPFVHHLARQLDLSGWVRNAPAGVEIELQGEGNQLEQFVYRLHSDAPPLAHIMSVESQTMMSVPEEQPGLRILPSLDPAEPTTRPSRTLVSPDVATCTACLHELFNPADRRYQYPFTNCTHCGPRFTIINSLPYDRSMTTMAGFPLCAPCAAEYHDPEDRRFHAQPVACVDCGPEIWFSENGDFSSPTHRQDTARTIEKTAHLLQLGGIVAIKGLGGFHLACRADDAAAVGRLRAAKARPHKPLAVMVSTIKMARRFCRVSPAEAELLSAPEAPIVLLQKAALSPYKNLGDLVAPQNDAIGVMLPYTPLHHLLLQAVQLPLVMTSGNRRGEPLCIDNQAALEELSGLADGFLFHNRPVAHRCDDSVVFAVHLPHSFVPGRNPSKNGASRPGTIIQHIRRSRGFAPLPVLLPPEIALDAPLVATGADLKNVSAVAHGREVFLTQYIGNLDSPNVRATQQQIIADFERFFNIRPQAIACDLHPDYAGSRYARQRAQEEGLALIEVQHHHAHIAGCLAENGVTGRAIGLSFDGTGYGPDGCIWGGEVLWAGLDDYERLYHLEYLPLPGGDAAVRRPYRTAIAYLQTLCPRVDVRSFFTAVPSSEMDVLETMLAQNLNTSLTSSMGRLFDAVSAILGLCHEATYEAQAALALEAMARQSADTGRYPFSIENGEILVGPMLGEIANQRLQGRPIADIARCFHHTIAEMSVAVTQAAREGSPGSHYAGGRWPVALSGGVWQNRLLLELTVPLLSQAGFNVLLHRQVPANDGGIAYGQAAVAAARLKGA